MFCMNAIFSIFLIISSVLVAIFSPDKLIPTMTSSIKTAIDINLTIFAVNAVWLSVFSVLEKLNLTKKLSRLMQKPLSLVFERDNSENLELIATSLTANMLGLGGVATPIGIKACQSLEKSKSFFNQTMLIVISATSIQILPTTAISIRSIFGSLTPSDILLPSIISTAFSTTLGILLTKIFVKR